MTWTPPWRWGLPQRECAVCETRCVKRTLADDGRCVQCVARDRRPEAPEPEALALFGGPA